ncbi:hypothetical protein [Taibaiella soli]|uniref:Uncharacterized protein n=1 Tax=Taibaiella soli TaxID=1649169 RepID=A0A2W2A896_9BACT|nr:hypothetical protein [Taibaiella soli]PZF71575.1 hypothetical protein DN068_15995 [Taibaiella soli]
MTLCLAWRNGNAAYLASDSRLTDAEKKVTSDEATKIFKIGVEVYAPTPHDDPYQEPQLLHRTNYGLCFAGSYLNGSILADTIGEVLSNIQAVPDQSDISIENLSNIAFGVYEQVSRPLMSIHNECGLSSVFFGGYCLETEVFRLYKFYALQDAPGQPVYFKKDEMALTNTPIYLGDSNAIIKAEELIALKKPGYTHFHLLREIIKDGEIATVGGKMQFGEFKWNTFKTNGIVEYSLEPNESGIKQVIGHFNYRGLSLDLNDKALRSGHINIMKTFFDPFESERWELFEETKKSIEEQQDKWEAAIRKKAENGG